MMTEPGHAPSAVTTSDAQKASRSRPESAPSTGAPPAPRRSSPGVTLLGLALLWLTVMMFVANAAVLRDTADIGVIVGSATFAQSLPAIIGASLIAGAAAGFALRERFATTAGGWRRAGLGAVAGLAAGLIPGILTLVLYGTHSPVLLLAVTIATAAALGGAGGASVPSAIAAAGLVSMLVISVLSQVMGLFQGTFRSMLGDGDTTASRLAAAGWVAFIYALTNGVAAGLVSFLVLRRRAARHWPYYAAAGATPGLLLLAGYGLTRIGGGPLISVVSSFSEFDAASMSYQAQTGLSHALVVLFVGAITGIIAVGHTMKRPEA